MLNLRVTVLSRIAIISVSLFVAATLTGCKADSNYFAASSASSGGGDGTSVDSAAGFRIRVQTPTAVDSFIHKFGDVTAGCEIPLASMNTATQINCMLNMQEEDLWYFGYTYEVSVPKGFCSYLVETPHIYYKGEAGFGPTVATMSTTDGNITACTLNGVAASTAGNLCSNSEVSLSPGGSPQSCAYDYSSGTPAGPNCCQGKVNVTVTATVNIPTGSTVTTTTSRPDYGGKVTNCLESANDYIDAWPKSGDTGKAIGLITPLNGASLIKTLKVPSPMSLNLQQKRTNWPGNFLNAGFAGWDEYAVDPTTWTTVRTIPRAIAPVVDKGNAGTHAGGGADAVPAAGTGAIVFDCLNPAGEVRHRINVYANGWNTIEDYASFKAGASTASVNPNRTGIAGVNCFAVNLGNSCNSMWSFDDIMKSTLALPFGGSGAVGAYVFPYEQSRPAPP